MPNYRVKAEVKFPGHVEKIDVVISARNEKEANRSFNTMVQGLKRKRGADTLEKPQVSITLQ